MLTFKTFYRLMFIAVCAATFYAFQWKSLDWVADLWRSHPIPTPTTHSAQADIQVAFLLDTSNSMDGLIEQAKSQMWSILNELATLERDGTAPIIEVALYEYGNATLSGRSGFVRQVMPFDIDVDLFSEMLFGLTTNGGDEFCGQVIHDAVDDLDWRSDDDVLKFVFIAGNESFSQGDVAPATAFADAREQGIEITTIFCGPELQGRNLGWAAMRTPSGEFFTIAQDEVTAYIETPYDAAISQYNDRLNLTYLPYGKKGAACMKNLEVQDANASTYSLANKADRAQYKISKAYRTDSWDLVEACKKDKSILKRKELLPDSLQQLSTAELTAKVARMSAERDELQTRLQELTNQRKIYLAEQAAADSDNTPNLATSVVKPIQKLATTKGFDIQK